MANNNNLKMSLLVLSAFLVSFTSAAGFCLQTNELQYLYPITDYSGNFTSVKEYWLRKDSDCYFIQDLKSKVTWYSTDIKVKYQRYRDEEDGQGCRGDTFADGEPKFLTYHEDLIMDVGHKVNNTCMIKYHFTNENTIHDLRLQVWNLEIKAVYLTIKLAALSTLGMLLYSSI